MFVLYYNNLNGGIMKQQIRNLILLSALCTLIFSLPVLNAQSWNAIGSGTNGTVNAVIVFNGQLIAAGSFTTPASNIAAWNGTSWSALGTGLNGVVNALTIFNNQLVAAGSFSNGGNNNIAVWNGTTWNPLGLGTDDTVFAAVVYNNTLRIGGKFTTAGGLSCSRLAGWNGTSWFQMPNGVNNGANNTVYALCVFGADLAIGGIFTTVGNNQAANRVVRYNSGSGVYTALGAGVGNNEVYALTASGTNLYVGGSFTLVAGVPVNRLALWNGTNWNTVGAGTNGTIRCFYLSGTNLFLGGSFTNIGNGISSWTGTAFVTFGPGITGGAATVKAITIWSNVTIGGGSFTTAGLAPVPASNIAGYGALPIAPTLISPLDGATGVSVTPVLDWSDVSNATTYGVQVSTNANFTNIIRNVTGLATSTYTVPTLANATTYFWRANAANGLGTGPFSLIRFFTTGMIGIINTQEIPLEFSLYQNYPNPFNPTTKIKFDLPNNNDKNATVSLVVYDITGKVTSVLLNTAYTAGKWELDFDASNLASGVYFYRINAGNFSAVNKMLVVK